MTVELTFENSEQGQYQGDGLFMWNDGIVFAGQYVDDLREGTFICVYRYMHIYNYLYINVYRCIYVSIYICTFVYMYT